MTKNMCMVLCVPAFAANVLQLKRLWQIREGAFSVSGQPIIVMSQQRLKTVVMLTMAHLGFRNRLVGFISPIQYRSKQSLPPAAIRLLTMIDL